MSTFDAEISVFSATVGTPSPEAFEAGASSHLELGIVAGLTLPIPNPQTGAPVVIPIGKLRFTFGREQAIELFEAAATAARALPEQFQPSGKLMVASSMNDVEAAHQNIKRATGR